MRLALMIALWMVAFLIMADAAVDTLLAYQSLQACRVKAVSM